jgi:LmbE family N-acetylglucosaminyl deacetylase
MKKVLILAAHPDDETLGCAGFIAKHRSHDVEFRVVVLGEGSTCRFSTISSDGVGAAIETRTRAAHTAMETLGVEDLVIGELPCGRFDQVPILEINKLIEAEIADFQPCTIFTHANSDVNNDHKIIHRATLMATRPCASNYVQSVFAYEVLSSSEWTFTESFEPNVFESLEPAHVELKWSALAAYETEIREFPFPRSREGIFAQAMLRGMQAGCAYAEAYKLIRMLQR